MNHLEATKKISLPELSLLAGTRVILGFGIALLVANRLSEPQKKAVGWAMAAIGAISTIPLVMEILGGRNNQLNLGKDSQAAA